MKLPIVFLTLLLCMQSCKHSGNSYIAAVENGLRHNILITDDKHQRMTLAERMDYYKAPAVSIAIIDNGKLAWAKAYGHISADSNSKKVDTNTLFQAASISKAFTALGALLLVQQGKLSLDEDVNKYIKSWKIPENEFTQKEKVTLRRLLSHTAGTSTPSFDGYAPGMPIPTTVEILEGKKPLVNSDPVRVIQTPGKEYRYSGGGTVIVQLLIEDVIGEKFDVWMKQNILEPFGMTSSTLSQPLTEEYTNHAASGHNAKGEIPGRWHIYPEVAPAGLWTTPTDLAHWVETILRILRGEQEGPISQSFIKEALKPLINISSRRGFMGLGFFLAGSGNNKSFKSNGSNEGFIAELMAWPELGKGFVVMINSDQAGGLLREIENSIADVYNLPGFEPLIKKTVTVDPSSYQKFTGIYKDTFTGIHDDHDHTMTVTMRNNKLFLSDSYVVIDSPHDMQLYPAGDDTFFMKEINFSIQFLGSDGKIDQMIQFNQDGTRMTGKDNKEVVFKKSKNAPSSHS